MARRWTTVINAGALAGLALGGCGLIASSGEISGRVDPTLGGGGGQGGRDTANATCDTAITVPLEVGMTVTRHGSTEGAPGVNSPGGGDCEAAQGPERIYLIAPKAKGFFTARLVREETSFDSVLYLRNIDDCPMKGGKTDCASPPIAGSGEVLSVEVQSTKSFYLFVDGTTANEGGPFTATFNLARGDGCESAIPITLVPGATMSVHGVVPSGASLTVACAGGAPAGRSNVVYHFSPHGLPKTLTVKALNGGTTPLLISSTGCPVTPDPCDPKSATTLKTDRDDVWIDAVDDTSYRLTVTSD
jgi:hypothetical protein